MKNYYIIYVETGEYESIATRICESFDEAKSHIMEYEGWWSDKGTCCIKEINENCRCLQTWLFKNGEQTRHIDHRQ